MPNPPSLFDRGPSRGATPESLSDYLQPDITHGLRIWWAYYWPTTVVVILASFWMMFTIRIVYERFEVPDWVLEYPQRYGVYVIQLIADYFAVYYVLHRSFRRFRIALLPKGFAPGATALKVTLKRSTAVWWAFAWRRVIYTIIVWVVVTLPAGVFLGIFRPSPAVSTIFMVCLGFVTGAAISLFILYSNILDEDYLDFTVRVVPRKPAAGSELSGQPGMAQAQP